MRWYYKIGLAVSALTLTAAIATPTASATPAAHPAVTPQAVTPSTDTDIEGNYYWNGDGYAGTLDIYSEVDGAIKAILLDNGQTEFLNGSWVQAINELIITRPLSDGTVQTYQYLLGGSPYSANDTMFSGYYKTSESGPGDVPRGSYLDSALAHTSSTPHTVSPHVDANIVGNYYWNGDGFTGNLDIVSQTGMIGTPGNEVWQISAVLTDNGQTEHLQGQWATFTNELTITRPIMDGSTTLYTQYYGYWLGGSPFDGYAKMFGGYYSTNATGNLQRGSYLDSAL